MALFLGIGLMNIAFASALHNILLFVILLLLLVPCLLQCFQSCINAVFKKKGGGVGAFAVLNDYTEL